MLPLRDTIRSYTIPFVTWGLIALNGLVFLFETVLPPAMLERFIRLFGLVPARLFHGTPLTWATLLTSMFLHGGWFHLISNMWVLFIFGDNVEDRMGHGRYLAFYLLSGLAAGLLQAFMLPGSRLPTVGASGAIAGVLGAYMLFFPGSRVVTLMPLFFFFTFVEIPALFYLGFWFVSQLYSGLFALALPTGASAGGVAWWAHVGGFLFGLLAARRFERPRPAMAWYETHYPWF